MTAVVERERSDPDRAPSEAGHAHHEHPPGTASFLPDGWWGLAPHRRRQVAAGVAAVVLLVIGVGLYLVLAGGDDAVTAEATADTTGGTTTTVDAAAYVAALSPGRVQTFDSLAQCESSGNWDDDTGNGFYGGLQFTLDSWQTVGGTGNPADASQDEQIMRADMLEQLQGWTAWPDCAAQLGLT